MRRGSLFGMLFSAAMLCVAPGGSLLAQAPGTPPTPGNPQIGNSPGYGQPDRAGHPPGVADMPGMNDSLSHLTDDKKFVKDATMGGLAQIELGKLAVQKGSSDSVKQYGQQMVDDHTKADEQLKQLATQQKVRVPDSLDSKHKSKIDKLAKLSGPDFDHAYMKEQLKLHQQDVREFQDEAQNGRDPNVRAFASKTLPTLQQHLETAKNLSKTTAH